MENKQLILPVSVISPTDVARLTREVESLDEFFRQSEIRQGGTPQSVPRYSRLLDEVVVANDLNLLEKSNRTLLLGGFQQLQTDAPVMHISFSVDPPGSYVQKIVGWLRQNIDGLVLVRIGLMPNIGAGCVVRTTNKSFDFSLRKYFDSKHDSFISRLHKVVAPEEITSAEAVGVREVKAEETNQQIDQLQPESPAISQEPPQAEDASEQAEAEASEHESQETVPNDRTSSESAEPVVQSEEVEVEV